MWEAAAGSQLDKTRLVTRLVDHWFASTRDNYLAIFCKFAHFMSSRDVHLSPPFVFEAHHLYAFVDMLLSRSPAGQSQLKVSTI